MSPEERRAAIIRATLPLLAEHGAAITTRQVATAAGIAEGTVFRAFTDKDELLRSCVDEALRTDHICAQIREVSVEQDLDLRLIEVGVLLAEHFARLGQLMQSLATSGYHPGGHNSITASRSAPGRGDQVRRELTDAITEILARDSERFRISVDDLAGTLLGLTLSLRFDPETDKDIRSRITERVDVLLHGALPRSTQNQPPTASVDTGAAHA